MPKDRQSSWAAGELTPDLHGQAGSPAYRSGAALLRNFLVTPQGTLMNRSGSVHIAELGSQTARLVPFLFGGDEPRLVQLYAVGKYAMRTPDGSFAESGADDTTGDTVSPSRAEVLDTLRRLRVAQCAGTMTLAKSDALTDIRRVDATHYVPIDVDFTPPLFGSSDSPYNTGDAYREPAVMTSATGFTTFAMAGDTTHPARPWDYVVTRVVSIEDGNPNKPNQVLETLPRYYGSTFVGDGSTLHPVAINYTVDSSATYTGTNIPAELAVYGDWTQRLDVSGAAGDPWTEQLSGGRSGLIVAHRVYRGRDGVYGYLGETTTRFFVDDGRDPDIANPPPAGTNPFTTTGDPSLPLCVAYANDRRILANGNGHPYRVWGSAVGNWSDLDQGLAPDDADALSFDLAANEHQEVRHLLQSSVLLAFAEKSTWAVTGSGNLEVLTPTGIAAREAASVGAAHYPAPIKGDGFVFFIEQKGGRPYALRSDANGAAQIEDLSLLSAHLFEGHTIVDWAWARDPHKTLWAVRDDGVLLSLAYGKGMEAWALHQIIGGTVEAVATLPVGHEDLLYMVVNRGTKDFGATRLTLERLAHRLPDDSRFACHLDCATISNSAKATAMTILSLAGGPPYSMDIYSAAHGVVVSDVIMFHDAKGLPVSATVTAVADADHFTVDTIDYDSSDPVTDLPVDVAREWGIPTSVVAVSIPDGTTVTAVVDGVVYKNLTVTDGDIVSGNVHLPVAGLVCVVGLPFKSQFQSLPIAQESGKQKVVAHALIKLARSRGGAVGTDFSHLIELPPRTVADDYGVIEPRAELHKVPVDASIQESAEVVVEQSEPKPIKVLFVEREYTLGG